MMKTYNLEFNMPYIDVDNFKQKPMSILISMITNSRLGEHMVFEGTGNITFESKDVKHYKPIVTVLDKYNRLKSNCLVFHLPITTCNRRYFDKLVIYYTAGSKIPSYGYVLHNSKTGKSAHIYCLDYDNINLLKCLNQTFNTLYNREIYDYYTKKNDAIKGRHGLTPADCPTVIEYNDIIHRMELRPYENYEELNKDW